MAPHVVVLNVFLVQSKIASSELLSPFSWIETNNSDVQFEQPSTVRWAEARLQTVHYTATTWPASAAKWSWWHDDGII